MSRALMSAPRARRSLICLRETLAGCDVKRRFSIFTSGCVLTPCSSRTLATDSFLLYTALSRGSHLSWSRMV
jgi:hypothetical protein